MTNPFMERGKGDNGRGGRRSEKRVSKSLVARQQPGSGAIAGAKGDMQKQEFLMEAKSTTNQSYRVEIETLRKIEKEAVDVNKLPAVVVSFTFPDGEVRKGGDWVMMRAVDFKELLEKC